MKMQPTEWNYLQIIHLIRGQDPKYIKNSHNSIAKKKIHLTFEDLSIWIDIFPKKMYRWAAGIWKDAKHH